MCVKCQKFGQTKFDCRKSNAILHCGYSDHSEKEYKTVLKCINCNGEHSTQPSLRLLLSGFVRIESRRSGLFKWNIFLNLVLSIIQHSYLQLSYANIIKKTF